MLQPKCPSYGSRSYPTDFSLMEVSKPLELEQLGAGEAAEGPVRQMGS